MINLMKRHPYKTTATALIVAGLAVAFLFRANIAEGGLLFNTPAPYNLPPATTTEAVKVETNQVVYPIRMSGKLARIVELKEEIAKLQAELDLLERN